ncbi:unnamed protein product [Didymodactylos carnosus]|uniref:Hexosyltransferase n=1 Tax=Didymodactylos carnosus TaxID=1234261 RepID=A0A814PKB9_9BILA|nr:unnamed protein product [Didymodactylos carnosus]CAF1214545.1 unnamed protein product [Didymodactylos carnosus]CAF3871699.1 unnamed protein product [Didymodactylos carnosus]CAF4023194.1 unnamed protein product [Didymodactylos carnosus]
MIHLRLPWPEEKAKRTRSTTTSPLVIIVKSLATNFEQRHILRDTWIKQAKQEQLVVYFMVAKIVNLKQQQLKIENENQLYQDIIQASFIDNYYNLTLKTLSILYWIKTRCNTKEINYLVIVDDDSWINIGRLKSNCLNKLYHGITGNLYRAEKPHREGKWAVSLNDYPQDLYPAFLAGGLGIFEMKYVHEIYEAATNNSNLPALFIDDVYITGIIAEQLKIERHNIGWGIISFKCDQHYSRLRLYQLLSILQCNIKQLKQIWNQTMTVDDYYRTQKFVGLPQSWNRAGRPAGHRPARAGAGPVRCKSLDRPVSTDLLPV